MPIIHFMRNPLSPMRAHFCHLIISAVSSVSLCQPLPNSQFTLSIGRWPNLILGDVRNMEYYPWKYRKIGIRLHNFVYPVVYSQARTDVPSGLLILFFLYYLLIRQWTACISKISTKKNLYHYSIVCFWNLDLSNMQRPFS